MTRLALSVALLLAFAVPAGAMEIEAFDRMSVEDKSLYVFALLDGSKRLLVQQGRKEMAARLVTVFDTVTPSSQVPIAMDQFDRDLDAARQCHQKTGKTMQVEDALLLTFGKFNIEIPRAELMRIGQGFKPLAAR